MARLDYVDSLIDWSQFDNYLRWLDPIPSFHVEHDSKIMFKAMLLQQWFALNAIEFDHEIADRLSFRRFVGLSAVQRAPDHTSTRMFAQLLVERGIAVELSNELQKQLQRCGLVAGNEDAHSQLDGMSLPKTLFDSAAGIGVLGPLEWIRAEKVFLEYWNRRKGENDFPTLDQIVLGELPELEPHLTLVRLMEDGSIKYELVGSAIEQANGSALLGSTLDQKADKNLKAYGHAGFQGEILGLLRRSIAQERPCGLSCVFNNSLGQRCQCWTVQAPIGNSEGAITMLLGVAIIVPVSIN